MCVFSRLWDFVVSFVCCGICRRILCFVFNRWFWKLFYMLEILAILTWWVMLRCKNYKNKNDNNRIYYHYSCCCCYRCYCCYCNCWYGIIIPIMVIIIIAVLQLLMRHYHHHHGHYYHRHHCITITSATERGCCSAWASNAPEWMTLEECCGSGNDLEFRCCFEESENLSFFISGNDYLCFSFFLSFMIALFLLFLIEFVVMPLLKKKSFPQLSLDLKDRAPFSPKPLSLSCTGERASAVSRRGGGGRFQGQDFS